MNRADILNLTDQQILAEVARLQYLFGHQNIIRHGLNRDSEAHQTQSTSEHIYNAITLRQNEEKTGH